MLLKFGPVCSQVANSTLQFCKTPLTGRPLVLFHGPVVMAESL